MVGGQREVKERQREGKERQWKDSGRAVEGQPEGQGKAHRIHSVCGRKTCAAAPQAKASVFGRVAAGAQGKAEGTLPKSVPSGVFSSPSQRVQSELQPSGDGRSSRRRTGIDQWNFEELEQSSTATMGEGGRERRGRRSSRRSRKQQREEQGGLPKSATAVESIAAAAVGLQTGGDGGRGSASQSFNAGADTQ